MSEIKENILKSTSLTGTSHLQQDSFFKEQTCGKNGYENMVCGLQINRTNDHPNGKHVYRKNLPDSQHGLCQEAAGPQQAS